MMKVTTAGHMDRVIGYLQQIAADQGVAVPAETESLFQAGVFDSFGLLDFVTFMEQELDIKIPDEDLLEGNFDTVAKIRAYIDGWMGG